MFNASLLLFLSTLSNRSRMQMLPASSNAAPFHSQSRAEAEGSSSPTSFPGSLSTFLPLAALASSPSSFPAHLCSGLVCAKICDRCDDGEIASGCSEGISSAVDPSTQRDGSERREEEFILSRQSSITWIYQKIILRDGRSSRVDALFSFYRTRQEQDEKDETE